METFETCMALEADYAEKEHAAAAAGDYKAAAHFHSLRWKCMDAAAKLVDPWEKRVQELEAEGCTRSDAQAVADAEREKLEELKKRIEKGGSKPC